MTRQSRGFQPPSETERQQAVGSLARIPEPSRRAFEPGESFSPLPVPGPDDWLANHPEPGQTYTDFLHSPRPHLDGQRNKIYLQPLGEFPPAGSPDLETLSRFTALFFTLETVLLAPGTVTARTRQNPLTRQAQILTTDVLRELKKTLPGDAFCLLAISMADLYPDPQWNFVFGQASLTERVGVYSFARYDPAFYGQPRSPGYQQFLLWRSCKVLAHETAHMFGLQHCIYYHCLLNGSNHLEESDARPLYLCPVDLRKLQSSLGFDPLDRYAGLAGFYRQVGFNEAADWVERRMRWIRTGL